MKYFFFVRYNQLKIYNERYKIIFEDIVLSNITGVKPLENFYQVVVYVYKRVFEIKFLVFQFQVPEYYILSFFLIRLKCVTIFCTDISMNRNMLQTIKKK